MEDKLYLAIKEFDPTKKKLWEGTVQLFPIIFL